MEDIVSSSGGNISGLLIWCVLLFGFMYFFMIRPNRKRMEDAKKMQDGLKIGDKVIVAAGIKGVIKKIEKDTVVVISGKSEIEVARASVSSKE
ncbi:MAG: preprotein translocase subunit YajC [Alphaproteobacteria bacterium]|nr:preprotein translocase subunit YajC [Alphaproteobacteria bacterium]